MWRPVFSYQLTHPETWNSEQNVFGLRGRLVVQQNQKMWEQSCSVLRPDHSFQWSSVSHILHSYSGNADWESNDLWAKLRPRCLTLFSAVERWHDFGLTCRFINQRTLFSPCVCSRRQSRRGRGHSRGQSKQVNLECNAETRGFGAWAGSPLHWPWNLVSKLLRCNSAPRRCLMNESCTLNTSPIFKPQNGLVAELCRIKWHRRTASWDLAWPFCLCIV